MNNIKEKLKELTNRSDEDIVIIKKRRIYKSADNENGYTIVSSKMYPQGDKEKFWFAYKEKRFNDVADCTNQYMLLACRNKTVAVLRFPKSFMMGLLDRLNTSVDDDGNIEHYHIVVFKNPNGKMTMLLSKPYITEIDITEYLVGEE